VRFTLSNRINSLALDIVDGLIEARYSTNKHRCLKKTNVNLEKLGVLLRICFDSQILSQKSYQYSACSLNEIGKMLGGWLRPQDRVDRAKAKSII